MNEYYTELSLLLGLSYTWASLKSDLDENSYIDLLLSTNTEFLQNIQKILKFLLNSSDLRAISYNFKLTPNLLSLITKTNESSGYCLVCDSFWDRLEDHLKESHELTKDYVLFKHQKYSGSFNEPCSEINTNSTDFSLIDYIVNLTNKSCEGSNKKIINKKKNPVQIKTVYNIIDLVSDSNDEGDKAVSKKKKSSGGKGNKAKNNPMLSSLAKHYSNKIVEKGIFGFDSNGEKIAEKEVSLKDKKDKGGEEEKQTDIICEICKVPLEKKERARHMKAHRNNVIVNCPVCDKEIKRRNMWKHKRIHLRNK